MTTKLKSTESKSRIITSIVMMLVIFPVIILLGLKPTFEFVAFDYTIVGLFSLIIVLVFYEVTSVFIEREKNQKITNWAGLPIFIISSLIIGTIGTTVMSLFVMHGESLFSESTYLLYIMGGMVLGLLVLLVTSTLSEVEAQKVMTLFIIQILFALYVTLLFITTSLLMWNITLMITLGTAASDTMGYFGGKLFGKTKAIPSISPNKTVEGYLVGFVSSIIVTTTLYFVLVHIFPHNIEVFIQFNIATGILVSVLIALIAPLGDLFFSKTKRSLGIKDFGNSLPGHGGVLDRLDSHVFAFSTASILLLLIYLV